VNSSGASEADMAAKIEVLEKQLAAALVLRGDESSDQRKDWMMAGTAQVEPIKANALVTRGKGKPKSHAAQKWNWIHSEEKEDAKQDFLNLSCCWKSLRHQLWCLLQQYLQVLLMLVLD
jgi:hypothetical protein